MKPLLSLDPPDRLRQIINHDETQVLPGDLTTLDTDYIVVSTTNSLTIL